jgi:hypothetical protein
MPFDIAQAISQLVGVVAGGTITFAGSHVGRRQQRCIGAFRRGDSIPRPPDRLAEYMDRIEAAALHDQSAAMTAQLRPRRDLE